MRSWITLAVAVAAVAAVPGPAPALASPVHVGADFDGDGYGDLAVGVPDESVGTLPHAGAVNVFYGSATGLVGRRSQLWHQDSPGVLGLAEYYDEFGSSLAAGDFDGDGRDDLAVGVAYETYGEAKKQGMVQVLYGSPTGLTATRDEIWGQGIGGVPGSPRGWEGFGWALEAGDFDDDGRDDLAIGTPGDEHRGSVTVLRGTTGGLAPGSVFTDPAASWEARYGAALAAGDVDGSGVADLVVGAPGESRVDGGPVVREVRQAGQVVVLFGAAGAGLSLTGSVSLDQDTPGVDDEAENSDQFGQSVAVADLDGDGRADLAVGVPWEDLGSVVRAGVVHVLPGSSSGPAAAGSTLWHQDVLGVPGTAAGWDHFGRALATGDLDGDGRADLAIGTPFDDDVVRDAGTVTVLFGATATGGASRAELWHQGVAGVPDDLEASDWAGWAVTSGDFDRDGRADLAIGVPGENLGDRPHVGVALVLRGAPSGLTTAGARMLHQDTPGVPGVAENRDRLGKALSQ